MTIETFVIVSLHPCKADPSKNFIRAHFCADKVRGVYFTAFNPAGVEDIEWVKRINTRGSHAGETRIESRYPVRVTYAAPRVQGSDVVESCTIAERPFEGKEMEPADAAALAAVQGAKPKPRAVTAPAAPAPAPTPATGDAESIG